MVRREDRKRGVSFFEPRKREQHEGVLLDMLIAPSSFKGLFCFGRRGSSLSFGEGWGEASSFLSRRDTISIRGRFASTVWYQYPLW